LFQTNRTLWRLDDGSGRPTFRCLRVCTFYPRNTLLSYVSFIFQFFFLNITTNRKSVDVILPTIPWPWLSVPPCILIIINLFGHYYFSCTVSPGFAGDPPRRVGHSFIWAKKRRTHGRASSNGVYWSSHLNITPASSTKCPKCGETKPEVRQHILIWDIVLPPSPPNTISEDAPLSSVQSLRVEV
jgi:hypothetical protein